MKLTIGIKALNEEFHIAQALRSALSAVQPFSGEVVLADSGSTDRTIDIARTFPVRIVQLANPNERCCGAGAQLAFQHARGEYFYLLDGDMVLEPGFLRIAMACLEAQPEVAAVGGRIREMHIDNQEFRIRAQSAQFDKPWQSGEVDRLDGGGLYRTNAVALAGFFADRNLHAFEEFELGARLRSQGWKLMRIDVLAVQHFGHRSDGWTLLRRRVQSGYSGGVGEVLRGAAGKAHWGIVLRQLSHVRNSVVVIAWWISLLTVPLLSLPWTMRGAYALVLLVLPLLTLTVRRRSLPLGLYSLVTWNVTAAGMVSGFFRHRVPPERPLASVVLQES